MRETVKRLSCPFCDYTGSRASIEGHISGKTDEAHQGKVGRDWRGSFAPVEVEKGSGESTESGGSPTSAALPDSEGESSDGDQESERSQATDGGATTDAYERQYEQQAPEISEEERADPDAGELEDADGDSADRDAAGTMFVLAATAAFAAVVLLETSGGSSEAGGSGSKGSQKGQKGQKQQEHKGGDVPLVE